MRSAAATDPLLNLFLERYHLNLLSVPRENIDVGELYIHDGTRTAAAGKLAAFLARPFDMPAAIRGESLATLAGTLSNSVEAEVGLGLLDGFLTALGATAALAQAKARWQANGARSLRFKLQEATRDSVDAGRLGLALIDNALAAHHPLVDEHSRYYLVAAVVRSASLTVAFEDEHGKALDLGADLTGMGSAGIGLAIARGASGEVTFAGKKPLALGVELYELLARGERIRMRLPDAALNIRTAGAPGARARPAFIGGEDADVFVNIDKEG
jgi:hypothetical protein